MAAADTLNPTKQDTIKRALTYLTQHAMAVITRRAKAGLDVDRIRQVHEEWARRRLQPTEECRVQDARNERGRSRGEAVKQFYCIAEYCAQWIYHGWWLYARETNDGRPNRGGYWGWMRSTDSWDAQAKLHALCRRMGHFPPPVRRYRDEFAEWFARTFPNGLRVRVVNEDAAPEDERYELVEIVRRRPKQRRHGVIRTIKGARIAEHYRRKREAAWEAAQKREEN